MKGKFKDIAKEFGLLNEQQVPSEPAKNTTAGEFEVDVLVQNEKEKVKIKYGQATGPLEDVTISWGDESHPNIDFEEGDEIQDHDNEGKDIDFVAYSQDDKWRFIVTVSVEANYELSGNIQDVYWDTLEIDVDDSKVDSIEEQDTSDTDDYGRSISGKDKRTFVDPKDLMPSARAKKMVDNKFTDDLEKEIEEKFDEYSSIREEKPGMYRVKFSFVRREFDDKVWDEMLEFITDKGFEIDEKMTSNYYEPNYDREEPAESVPMIYFSTEEQDDFEAGFKAESLQEIFKRRAGII